MVSQDTQTDVLARLKHEWLQAHVVQLSRRCQPCHARPEHHNLVVYTLCQTSSDNI